MSWSWCLLIQITAKVESNNSLKNSFSSFAIYSQFVGSIMFLFVGRQGFTRRTVRDASSCCSEGIVD